MCPKFKVLYNSEVDQFNKKSAKYKDLLDYVSLHSGQKFTNISNMYDIYDTLLMQVCVYNFRTISTGFLFRHNKFLEH